MKKCSYNEMDILDLKVRSLRGINSLVKRQAIIRTLSFLANIVLARLLIPQIFGIYAVVAFVVQFFSMFGNVGIGAALIQKKGELSRVELSSTFWLQQVLIWFVVCAVFVAAPLVLRFYPSLPPYGPSLIRVMAVSLALDSLKTIPVILMERELDFSRIALVDVVETAVFYSSAILMAICGFEVWSFIIAALLKSFSGVFMIYMLSSWRPSRSFKISVVKDLVCFGIAYQGSGVISFIKDAVTPLFVGIYSGTAAVGYVNWAKTLALAPLMFSEAFSRIAFPAFSKIQGDRELLGRAVERSIRSLTLIMFPVTMFMLALGPEIIRVVFTPKWLPGLLAYYFFCTSPLVIGVVLPMYSAILSLGKSGIILRMTAALAALEWGLGIPFVITFDFNGISFSQPVIAVIFYFVYRRVLRAKGVRVPLLKNTGWQFLASVFAGLVCGLAARKLPESAGVLLFLFLLCLAVYILFLMFTKKSLLKEFVEQANEVIIREVKN